MHVIHADNPDHALVQGLSYLTHNGELRGSRNGRVRVAPGPVTTVYRYPLDRVSQSEARDANPFFHLYEALWMLGGRRDVKSVSWYVKRMENYSDDGTFLHGAYGYRWREHFEMDQLEKIARTLRINPEDRRCVLQMWDARVDLGRSLKDLPCNTHVYFLRGHRGELDMTVMCRSNDIIWGAYGANAVHFSVLQEYMASRIGCRPGTFYQVSNNYHAYLETMDPLLERLRAKPYQWSTRHRHPLVTTAHVSDWEVDLRYFLDEEPREYADPFFRNVAQPMHDAYKLHKLGHSEAAIARVNDVRGEDWRWAGIFWLHRHFRQPKSMASGTNE